MTPLPPDLVAAYLARLGVEAAPPTAAALATLHRAHVERVPWETVWIHEGLGWGIDPATSAARIATTGRGGYCFHLNGAFGALLAALGYDVTLHVGGVHGPEGPGPDPLAGHVALVVAGLRSDACPEGRWYADVGLGDALHDPVPLVAGPLVQPPFRMALEPVGLGGPGDWHLVHDPRGTFAGMRFGGPPATVEADAATHVWLSTAPESGFVRLLVAQRRTAGVASGLRGLTHTTVTAAGVSVATVDDRAGWLDLLADGFGIVPADPGPLWERTRAAHEAWVAAEG